MSDLEQISLPHLHQELYRGTLPSGMQVVLIPKPDFKEQTAMLSVAYGGIDTSFTLDGKRFETEFGLAHFLEHQVFENHGKKDFAQLFTALGCDSNAFTGFTSTNYFFSGIDQLKKGLELLLDLVGDQRFTESSIIKEQSIIKQEIDMYQDDPDHRLYSAVLAGLFPETPLAVDLAGEVDKIDKIELTDLSQAFEAFYRPSLMMLVLIGDIVVDEVFEWLTDLSSQIETPSSFKLTRSAIAYHPVIKKQSLQMDVVMPKLGIGFRMPPTVENPLVYKTALKLYINMVMGWTSATYQKWYDEGKIDDSFDVLVEVDPRFQFVMVLLDTAEPIGMSNNIKQALKKGRTSTDVSEDHLFTLKKEMYGEFLMSLDRVDELASLYLEHSTEDLLYVDFPDVLDQLDLETVVSIGEHFFKTADAVDVTIFKS